MKFAVRSMAAAFVAAVVLSAVSTVEAKAFKLFGAAEEQLPAGPTLAPMQSPMRAPVLAAPASAAVATMMTGDCCQPCCPTPCIKYRNAIFDCKVRCCDPCAPPTKAVLHVKNPCTCCPVDVPVCLPSCCCGEPCVECKKGLLGSSTVSYKWCCGVTVNVRFDKCGDVLVTYRGT